MKAYIHTCHIRKDGTKDCFLTRSVEVKNAPLWWQNKGLSYTASGYGARIPTTFMVRVEGRWRRVYCHIYSNSGALFVGRKYDGSCTVQIDPE